MLSVDDVDPFRPLASILRRYVGTDDPNEIRRRSPSGTTTVGALDEHGDVATRATSTPSPAARTSGFAPGPRVEASRWDARSGSSVKIWSMKKTTPWFGK
jgi:hypothetical protein